MVLPSAIVRPINLAAWADYRRPDTSGKLGAANLGQNRWNHLPAVFPLDREVTIERE
jgi:hypothetical protein